MDETRLRQVSGRVVAEILRSAEDLARHFPAHANAVRGEVRGTKMTNERWLRVKAIVASLHCVPGAFLSDDERECRAVGFRLSALIERMAHVTAGLGRIGESLDFVEWLLEDMRPRDPDTGLKGPERQE